MSMISSLIDKLNKSADEWNGSNMFELARMCREAADTITELRGALQVASVDYRHLQDENARLRSCLSDDAENARMIMAENAKLRELVRDMWHEGMCECGSRGKCASCEYDYPTRMRELGIEEDA